MKWRARESSDVRIRRSFLFLPRTINGETRWMEWACWKERDYNHPHHFGWKPLCWMEAA